jgi:hypothetical protein
MAMLCVCEVLMIGYYGGGRANDYVIPKVCVALVPIGTSVVVTYSQGIQANVYALLPISRCQACHVVPMRRAYGTHAKRTA